MVSGIHLTKVFVIISQNSKNLTSVHNEAEQIIHATNIHKSKLLMDCYTELSSVANTIEKFHIMSDLHYDYIHKFYNNKQDIII